MTAPLPDTALKLRVRNVAGIKEADLVLRDLVLVCGINGAGKSSLLQSAAAAAQGTAYMRDQKRQRDAKNLVRDGAEAGSIVISYPGGENRITYPDCKVTNQGIPQALGTALGIGAVSLMSLAPIEKARAMTERLKAEPTKEDLAAWLKGREGPVVTDEAIDLTWQRIEASGWDAVHAAGREHASILKGKWEQATGENWGPKKASLWYPPVLIQGETYDLAEAEAEVQRLERKAREMSLKVVSAQFNEADLKAKAAQIPELQAEEARLKAQSQAYDQESDRLMERREALPDATDASQFPPCPHCAQPVQVARANAQAPIVLLAPPDALAGEALEQRRADRRMVLDAIEKMGRDINRNAVALATVQERLRVATKAEADLKRAMAFSEVSRGDIDQAQQDWREAGHKRDAIRALIAARAIYDEWALSERLLTALAPDGVRADVLQRRMAAFNKRLGDIVDTANKSLNPADPTTAGAVFREVSFSDDFDARYDGRPYTLLSESEKWRVDLVIAAALGQIEGARLIVVDRLDVLHAPARKGVLLMLKSLGIPALIGMTAKQVDDAPNLKAAGIGTRHWINQGIIEGSA